MWQTYRKRREKEMRKTGKQKAKCENLVPGREFAVSHPFYYFCLHVPAHFDVSNRHLVVANRKECEMRKRNCPFFRISPFVFAFCFRLLFFAPGFRLSFSPRISHFALRFRLFVFAFCFSPLVFALRFPHFLFRLSRHKKVFLDVAALKGYSANVR